MSARRSARAVKSVITIAITAASVSVPCSAHAEGVDVGVRTGYARPAGGFDAGSRATDGSFGAIPLALDVTLRLSPARRTLAETHASWSVAAGLYGAYAATIPTLCTTASECISSIGRDTELGLVARIRAPRLAFLLPEGELGAGWSWSSRSLVDREAVSTRAWNGPVLLRAALVPSIRLGTHTRLGLVVGGSVARSTSFALDAPGVSRRGIEGARLHGTLDAGVRLGIDFGQ
jgi:hypothetical protein